MLCAVCLPCCRYVENALAGAILQSSTFVNTSTSCGGFCLAAGAVYIGRCVDCAVVDVAFRNSSVVAAVNDSLNAQCSTLPQTVGYNRGGCSPRALGSALAMNFDATPALMNRVQVVQFSAASCGVILGGAISIVSTSTTRRLVLQVRPLCFSILSASDCLLSRFAIGCEVQHVLTLAGQAVDISRGSAALFGGSANSLINPSSELTGVGIRIGFDNAGIYVIDSSFADLSSAASGNAAANIFHQVHVPALCFMSRLRTFGSQASRNCSQGGGLYVDTLKKSLEVRNVSFARISMFSNGTLSSAAAGGINVNTNVTARLKAMLTCACRRYTIDSFLQIGGTAIFNMTGCSFVNITHAAVGANCTTTGAVLL